VVASAALPSFSRGEGLGWRWDNGVMTSPHQRRDVVVLGSTGSIGTQALDVVRRNPGRFRVVALSAGGSDPRLLAAQAVEFGAGVVAVAHGTAAEDVHLALFAEAQRRGYSAGGFRLPKVLVGPRAAEEAAGLPCDVVLNGITGAVGLGATLAALEAGRTLALANKESLIIGGDLVRRVAARGQIVPVDSEHSALAQCLRGGTPEEVRRLVLTASGGPFRGRTREDLAGVTPEQALNHPTWDMGPVVTINSATLVNKGLEVIEAHLLFDVPLDRIEVVVHPQSVVHSMVEFTDGSTLAQASPPDMRIPIALGLGWPDRVPDAAPPCDWTRATAWEFFPLDHEAFPAVALAARAAETGRTAPAVYNAANEVCVEAFRAGRLPFTAIVDTIAGVLGAHDVPSKGDILTLDGVLAADAWARERARELTEAHPVDETADTPR
jgi:1-deoxy-D-xylulose-5-phosphate reductoisomerase